MPRDAPSLLLDDDTWGSLTYYAFLFRKGGGAPIDERVMQKFYELERVVKDREHQIQKLNVIILLFYK